MCFKCLKPLNHGKFTVTHDLESESEVTCGQIWCPILWICALHLTHPSAHTQQWTHTHREHTPGAVGSQCCGARGAVGGSVPCSTSVVVLRVKRERWIFTSPTYNSCQTWDSNTQPSGYKSDSLSIRPRLPRNLVWVVGFKMTML